MMWEKHCGKGMNAFYMITEIVQRSMSNLNNINVTTMLKATTKEHTPMPYGKRDENAECEMKANEGCVKPTKFVPITYFY